MRAAAVIGRIHASSKTILHVLCFRENCILPPKRLSTTCFTSLAEPNVVEMFEIVTVGVS